MIMFYPIYVSDNVQVGLGKIVWYDHVGRIHRGDGKPAVLYHSGRKEWWRWGIRYRDNDYPHIVDANLLLWYSNVNAYGYSCVTKSYWIDNT